MQPGREGGTPVRAGGGGWSDRRRGCDGIRSLPPPVVAGSGKTVPAEGPEGGRRRDTGLGGPSKRRNGGGRGGGGGGAGSASDSTGGTGGCAGTWSEGVSGKGGGVSSGDGGVGSSSGCGCVCASAATACAAASLTGASLCSNMIAMEDAGSWFNGAGGDVGATRPTMIRPHNTCSSTEPAVLGAILFRPRTEIDRRARRTEITPPNIPTGIGAADPIRVVRWPDTFMASGGSLSLRRAGGNQMDHRRWMGQIMRRLTLRRDFYPPRLAGLADLDDRKCERPGFRR